MKRIMNQVEGLTFEGILKLSEEKWGIKYTMGITDILYLHHIRMRNIVGSGEDKMKSYLMSEGHSSNDTLSMIKRYNIVKEDLFEYNFRIQSIMDRVNQYGDASSITSWEQIDNLHMGVIKEDKGYKVVDISQGKEKLLATIKDGINWVATNLNPNQMNYIVQLGKSLKSTNGRIIQ
jgi:hypothetical protein